jgi:cobalamin 5'-phosphate synthase/cobalamin synthase
VITLVLGGVRSGKSEVAEHLAGPGPGTYLATGLVAPDDDDFADRVARHRARRPAAWATVEEPRAVPGVLARLHGPVLLDALGTWVANDLRPDLDALVAALVSRRGDTVVVSEEVGLGVHPVSEVGRLFADRLGEANRRVAEVADRCILVVAGRIIELPAGGPADHVASALRPGASAWNAGPSTDPTPPPPTGDSGPIETSPLAGLRQAVAFLTPLGGAASPSPAAFAWFPAVGVLLGLLLGSLWWAAADPFGPLAAAALVVTADLALTGALHFDGLLDSADGLLPHMRPDRRLTAMADPNVGAFAVATGGTTLLLRVAALAALGPARPLLLAALWSLSRAAMAVTALTGRYARSHGLASSFLPQSGGHWVAPAAAGAVVSVGLAAGDDFKSVAAVLTAAAAAAAVAALARQRLNGFTGDTLGAGGIVAETIGLLTAVAVLRP